jgi:ubiquinone/menaquinone biosynthesis C-methylase UbiE
VEAGTAAGALAEVSRVIKTNGRLAIVEFHKIDGPPGPPRHIRLDPAEVEALVAPYGFARQQTVNLGSYNYLITFIKKDRTP